MAFAGFPPTAVTFLGQLAEHNDRAWFLENRETYDRCLVEPGRALVDELGPRLAELVPELRWEAKVGGSLFRINRDTRFSRDKRPYKTHFDVMFWQGDGPSRECPGYFLRLMPDRLVVAAGKHHFEEALFEPYRRAVDDPVRGAALARVLADLAARDYGIGAQSYKRVPAPHPADHPRGELLKHGALWAGISFHPPPEELHSPALVDLCLEHYRAMKPVADFLFELTSARDAPAAPPR